MNDYPKVLYVEDDPMSRLLLDIVLKEQMGLSDVAIFEDSERFSDRISELDFTPDIVLLDIQMKPIDGFTMLQILHQHASYQGQPIVALTASVMSDEVEKLREAGFNSLISKPITEAEFPNQLYRILAGEAIWAIP